MNGLRELWYTARVLTGLILQIVMLFAVFTSVEHAFSFLEMNAHTTDAISHAYSRQVHYLVALAVFASGMAGANWVKSNYIRFCLPEVMDSITKKIVDK